MEKTESEVGELHRRGVAQGKSWGRGGINCPASPWLFLLADEGDDLPLVLAGSRARGGIGLCLAGFVTGEVVLPGSPLELMPPECPLGKTSAALPFHKVAVGIATAAADNKKEIFFPKSIDNFAQ